MKKIILSTLILTALYSCKKEGQKIEDTAVADSVSVTENTVSAAGAYTSKELSPE
jgi:hypothetical protein